MNIAVFGMGRSGTHGLTDILHQENPNHICSPMYFYDGGITENLKSPWLISLTASTITDHTCNFLIQSGCQIYLTSRSIHETFLGWVMMNIVSAEQMHYNIKEDSIYITREVFKEYLGMYKNLIHYRDIMIQENRIHKTIKYSDMNFVSDRYKNTYNLKSKMDYIQNKPDVIRFLDSLQQRYKYESDWV